MLPVQIILKHRLSTKSFGKGPIKSPKKLNDNYAKQLQ